MIQHNHQLGVVRWEDLFDDPEQAPVVGGEIIDHPLRRLYGDAEQGRLEFLEGVRAGEHLRHHPVARPRNGAGPEGGKKARSDDTGLAAPRGADEHDQSVTADRLSESVDKIGAPEEIGGVGLLKCSEALIGIAKWFRRSGVARRFGGSHHIDSGRLTHCAEEVLDLLVAMLGPVGGGTLDHLVERRRNLRPRRPNRGKSISRHRCPTRKKLDGKYAQAVDIAA